jgi:hypothetical protein
MPSPDVLAKLHLGILLAIGVTVLLSLGRLFRAARGTTLAAVWIWSAIAMTAAIAAELLISQASGSVREAADMLRFAAATATFCPLIALLGAKRPQDRAWQLIVVSFWAILALPAVQGWLLRSGQPMTVHPIWSWFLAVLIVVGASNYLPTRYAIASLLAAAGQTILVWRQLPWGGGTAPQQSSAVDWMPAVALGLFAAAAATAAIGWPRRMSPAPDPLERLWRDFCDRFGVVWGLRVAERINATAVQHGWDVRLTWRGLTQADGTPLASPPCLELEAALRPLLRRFVSTDWIDRRLGTAAQAFRLPSEAQVERPHHKS